MSDWFALFLFLGACAPGAVPPDAGPTIADSAAGETAVPDEVGDSQAPDTTEDIPPADTSPDSAAPTVEDIGSLSALAIRFDPPGGGFGDALSLSLSAQDEGAVIQYTLDGSLPSADKGTLYTGPIVLTTSAQVRAVAWSALGVGAVGAAAYSRLTPEVRDFSSNLPVLVLQSEQPAPTSDGGAFTPFVLNVFEPPEGGRAALLGDATLSTRAGLKVRGSSSADYPKKPYSLETRDPGDDGDQDVELLGMPPEGDWVLYAPLNFDRAFVRNALIYALSNTIGRWAPRTRFAEVFVAGSGSDVSLTDYVGLYVVMERIERDTDRVDVARIEETDTAQPQVTGGYIFKRDRLGTGEDGFRAGTGGGAFEFAQPLVYVYPEEEDIVPEQADYLAGALDVFGLALAAEDFTLPATGQRYSELIDVDSWIDHHVLNVLSKNPDAFRLSGYFHKDREGPIMAGPVWDFDRTMGCDGDGRASDPENWDATNETSDTTNVFDHGWWRGLFSDPDFRDAYWDRWRVLLDGPMSVKNLDAEIEGLTAELDEAAARNFARWSDYPPRGSYRDEVELLKQWLEDRHDWISACLDSEVSDYRSCGE